MSLQQVNLYQEELKPKQLKYSAEQAAKISITIVIVLSLVVAVRFIQLQTTQSELAESQQLQKQTMANLQKVQTELSGRKKDASLAKRVAAISKELANKQKVFGILSQDEFGNTKGFVEHVSGLARQRIDGLWLTHLTIAEGGTNIALHGSTTKPALLPKYLQRLSAEKAFVGTEFESLLMARQEKKEQWLNFSLQNKKADAVVN